MSKYENVETVIDRFLDYVKNNQEVSLSKVASALAINLSQAERIALLLEQSGFIEIHYGIGDTRVSVKGSEGKKEKPIAENKTIEQSKIIEQEVLAAENLLKFLERDIARRIEIAEELLKDIEKQGGLSKIDVVEIERQVDLALGQLAAFSSEVKTLADAEEQFYERLTGFKEKLHSLKTTENLTQELSLIDRIIQWIKSLFAKAREKHRRPTRRKKHYDKQAQVLFVGRGEFQPVKKRALMHRNRVHPRLWKRRKRQ